jgi:adenylate cyclase
VSKEGKHPALVRNLMSLAIGLGIALLLFVGFLVDRKIGHPFEVMESRLVDRRFLLRGPHEPSGEVVVVVIDSKSVERIGRWPWSRAVHVNFIDRMREWNASTLAFDVLFTESEGAAEVTRLQHIAATLPRDVPKNVEGALNGTRLAIQGALAEVQVDKLFAGAIERTYDDDAALTVLAFDFVFHEELKHWGQLGSLLAAKDEQLVLDLASYLSRDENTAYLRKFPPKLALGVRPIVADLAEWVAGLGFVNPVYDRDGVLRREQLVAVYSPVVRDAFEAEKDIYDALLEPEARVQAYMPLAVAGVATHLRLSADQVQLDLAEGELRFFEDAEEPRIVHRFDPFDGTAWIDFYGASQTFPTYSYVDVLGDQLIDAGGDPISGREAFEGKLVFVGHTDPGLSDFFVTPFITRLPGVEKHANVAENLLTGRQLHTHHDYVAVVGLCAAVAAIIVAVAVANLGPLLAAILVGCLSVGWLFYTYLGFANEGLVWNWSVPGLTVILAYAGVTAYRTGVERRAKRAMTERSQFIQATFGRYLSAEVVSLLVDSPDALKLGGERRRLTVMMSDLRGFTALCERSTPETVTGLLNFYLGRMAEIIFKHGGTIDEFIGDAIMGLFGAPVKREDDARRAVACAIEMQLAMPEVNQHLRDQGFPEVEMGIAINTGEVIVGNIGSERRTKYGVVGTNVNLTARIESYTVGGQVYISGETLKDAGKDVETGAVIAVKAKGLAEPIPAYELRGIGEPYDLRMPELKEELYELVYPVQVTFGVLEGKHITDTMVEGALVRISAIGADLRTELELDPLTNIKVRVRDVDGEELEGDLYAKVIDREAREGCCAMRFTSTPPAVKDHFKSILKAVQS